MGGKEVEMSDADFGNIERKVLLEDRPWTDRRCGYFSVLCVLFFICSAIGLGATGAPRYDTNSDNEIEGPRRCINRIGAARRRCAGVNWLICVQA